MICHHLIKLGLTVTSELLKYKENARFRMDKTRCRSLLGVVMKGGKVQRGGRAAHLEGSLVQR